jgi:luciferase-like monooxygenase
MIAIALPPRAGPRPTTTSTNPHTQLDQQPADARQRDRLAASAFALPGVQERPSLISVPGARALWLAEGADGPPHAFLIGAEFAHLHPGEDQSLHVMLPPELVDPAIAAGWAEVHPVARRGLIPTNAVMLYAPRDDAEREVIESLLRASHAFARGESEGSPRPS